MEWISINEQLPREEERVLLYTPDDVFGDDPTVNKLQEKVAAMLGKEAALFVPSGTMANTIAILAHTQPGDEVIVERESHTFNYEVAGAAVMGGVQLNTILGERGILAPDQIEREIREPTVHIPPTRLICLENTHNRGGGSIYPLEKIRAIHQLAQKNNLKMHLDGARLFNACVATGLNPSDYAQYFDSVMFCFSKGLGAPIGSILAGSKMFIQRAHRVRKMLGGGMRQVGILAAAALYALENNISRLAEDHAHAKILATELAKIKGFQRVVLIQEGTWLIGITHVGSFEANVAASLLKFGFDIGIVCSKKKTEYRISIRANKGICFKTGLHLGKILKEISEEIGTNGGGHNGAASLTGKNGINIAKDKILEKIKQVLNK